MRLPWYTDLAISAVSLACGAAFTVFCGYHFLLFLFWMNANDLFSFAYLLAVAGKFVLMGILYNTFVFVYDALVWAYRRLFTPAAQAAEIGFASKEG